MNAHKQLWAMFTVTLALIGATAAFISHHRIHLGLPGVKTHPLPGSQNLEVDLPQRVLDYQSQWIQVDAVTSNTLPHDTSFGERIYQAPDGFQLALQVVLMGTDRTSLHKPQFCLEGQGLHIDQAASKATTIPIDRPRNYDLPVVKLIANGEREVDGQKQQIRAIYVYWYVADDAISAGVLGFQRMWLLGSHLLRTGVLERWSYVSTLAFCLPGQEDATFARMKKFIAASVPEFQLNPKPLPSPTALGFRESSLLPSPMQGDHEPQACSSRREEAGDVPLHQPRCLGCYRFVGRAGVRVPWPPKMDCLVSPPSLKLGTARIC